MGERKSRWVIVTPTGDQIVFGSLTELQEALMGSEQGEQEDQEHMRVSTCDLEPSQAFAAAQRHVVAGRAAVAGGSPRAAVDVQRVAGRGTPSPYQNTLAGIPLPQHVMAAAGVRTTHVGGFAPQGQGAPEMRGKSVAASGEGPSGAALLRNTPVPPSGPRGRVRLRRTTPAGLFAPPANPRLPAPAAANDALPGRGPSGTKPGLIAPQAPAPRALYAPPPASAEVRRAPRFASASPTCPGLYPNAKTRTSPGIHQPGRAPDGAPAARRQDEAARRIEPARVAPMPMARLEPLPPVPVAPMRPRATPSPSGEPSLDSVDAIWAAMLQSTSKFVPFPMPPRAPSPVDPAAQHEAQVVDEGWASAANIPALPPHPMPEMQPMQPMPMQQLQPVQAMPQAPLNEPGNPFMKGSERALLEAYPRGQTPPHAMNAARVAQGWAPPPIPTPPPIPPGYAYDGQAGFDQGGFRPQGWQEQGGGGWQEQAGAYQEQGQASYPEPSGFGDYRNVEGHSELDLNALPMPPPSLPVRSHEHGGPDLSEAMREQVPADEAPRYSIPSLDDRDSSSSASMPLMHEPERRFPRWWFPLIAAAGFGVGVLLVVGREGPPSRNAAADSPKAVASAVQEAKPAAPPVVATATTEPAPVAPTPVAPAPIEPTPVAVNERAPEPPQVGTTASERRSEPAAAPAKVIELGSTKAADKPDKVEKTDKSEKTDKADKADKTEKPAAATADATGEPGATPAKLEGKSNYDKAVNAQRSGDLAKARTLFRQVTEKDPHNFEAQTGLGDVARAMGEKQEAVAAYRHALAENASFYPALLGLADALWESGDKTAASERYAEIARLFSPSMYPNRVRERVSGGETP